MGMKKKANMLDNWRKSFSILNANKNTNKNNSSLVPKQQSNKATNWKYFVYG
jgi:hypothetical protein